MGNLDRRIRRLERAAGGGLVVLTQSAGEPAEAFAARCDAADGPGRLVVGVLKLGSEAA
jgi:hypothetical protein